PALPLLTEARYLHRDVRTRRQRSHRRLPASNAFGAAIGRQTRVIEDDGGIGEIARKPCRLREVPPRRLQVEAQMVATELRIARAPLRVRHAARCRFCRRAICARL